MKTILCAVDGSEPAQRALEFAIDLARDTSASLAVMVVKVPPPRGRGGGLPIAPIEEYEGCDAIVDAAVAAARAAGVETRPMLASGNPADEIAEGATRIGADLVVVGSRGLGPISRALLGSVSRALVKRSRVPVTVVAHAAARQPVAV